MTNLAEINSTHVHLVTMAKLEFDTPVYVHSSTGTITYDSNDYLGVGSFGGASAARESENLGPVSVNLSLTGIDSDLIAEAKDSGKLYDRITIYQGYVQDDGTLVDDPWIVFSGWFDYASIQLSEESTISITCQHDLSSLSEKLGSRYSDEDQQNAYSTDVGLEFTTDMSDIKLQWGGGPVGANSNGGSVQNPSEWTNQP